MNVMVVGGAGYLGSHTVLQLLKKHHNVVVIDEVKDGKFNGRLAALKAVERISGVKLGSRSFRFYNGKLGSMFCRHPEGEPVKVEEIVRGSNIEAAIDFAAFIESGASMQEPERYFINNCKNFFWLVPRLYKAGVKSIVKSSTAAVYGNLEPGSEGFSEAAVLIKSKASSLGSARTKKGEKRGESLHRYLLGLAGRHCQEKQLLKRVMDEASQNRLRKPVSVYGWTKVLNEIMLEYFAEKFNKKFCLLRYFNAWGTEKGLLEGHRPETHLIPKAMDCIISQERCKVNTPLREGELLYLFGTDFNTPDGTCIRDYIHVSALAEAHIKAMDCQGTFNIGLGKGFSNWEILRLVASAAGTKLAVVEKSRINKKAGIAQIAKRERALYVTLAGRRSGDAPKLIANPLRAHTELKLTTRISPENLGRLREVYLTRKKNPLGYRNA